MALKLSPEGPEFPRPLIDALIAGDVVFLCGAGVSAPQLPGFSQLVDRVYTALGVERDGAEELAFSEGRYEEVLGSLSRRLSDPASMLQAVAAELDVPANANLDNHRTVLRLSRDLENRPLVVTTNFDTLIEQAWLHMVPQSDVGSLSFAGQALPPPGSATFSGIIHIHGRLGDPVIGVEKTPLVLTSADYGDAYMRSAWASRFLFDLVRCKTVVLLGYRAGDAPVRYFLSVLEADRERFPDLNPVYAFDAVSTDLAEADARWAALAVTPIAYTAPKDPDTNVSDHSVLWHDLAALADIVERPKKARRERTRQLVARPVADLSLTEIKEITWLLDNRHDLWDIVIPTLNDPKWFDKFQELKLWSDTEAAWVIPAWIDSNLQDRKRVTVAIEWGQRLGAPFREALIRRLTHPSDVPAVWMRLWRLFCHSLPASTEDDFFGLYALTEILQREVVLDSDLRRAVQLIGPALRISASVADRYGMPVIDPPRSLTDIVSMRLELEERDGQAELCKILMSHKNASERLVDLTTAELRKWIELTHDAGTVDDDWDPNDHDVPSVEDHAQNAYGNGVVLLVRLLATLLPSLAESAPGRCRHYAELWRIMRGSLGPRLWLHALRSPSLFAINEVISGVLSMEALDFWNTRRELPLVLKERFRNAEAAQVQKVEQRVIEEAESFFARYDIDPGQTDWRPYARDSAVWLRLKMLQEAGVIGQRGRAELEAIEGRHEHLRRMVKDSDFFGSYLDGVQRVTGDPTPIAQSGVDERLEVARQLSQSNGLESRQGWPAYCRSDPMGAFETLVNAPLSPANVPLWSSLIISLAHGTEAVSQKLRIDVLSALCEADDAFIEHVDTRLVDLLANSLPNEIRNFDFWWNRLWSSIVAKQRTEKGATEDILFRALNSPAGKLTHILLSRIEAMRDTSAEYLGGILKQVRYAASEPGPCGALACTILAHYAGFLLSFDESVALEVLCPRMSGKQAEAAALRRVLLQTSSFTQKVSRIFADQILLGSTEYSISDQAAEAARKTVLPALRIVRGDAVEDHWGTTVGHLVKVLREGRQEIREGAANLLGQWIEKPDLDPAEFWRSGVGPLLAQAWPKERKYRTEILTSNLVTIAVRAGDAFPDALEQLKPYLTPLNSRSGIRAIVGTNIAERFPHATLDLAWMLHGPNSRSRPHDLPKLLDRLVAKEPSLEVDRRLQWLEQKAVRYL